MAPKRKHVRKHAAKAVETAAHPEVDLSPALSAFDAPLISWVAPEFLRYKRGRGWYAVVILFAALCMAYAVWTQAWSMLAAFAVLLVVVLMQHRKDPRVYEVSMTPYGIQFGPKRMPFSQLKKFWVLHDPPYVDELHLLTGDRMHPEVMIPLMGVDALMIREFLRNHVQEWEGKKESFLDLLVRILRLN